MTREGERGVGTGENHVRGREVRGGVVAGDVQRGDGKHSTSFFFHGKLYSTAFFVSGNITKTWDLIPVKDLPKTGMNRLPFCYTAHKCINSWKVS